MEIKTHDRWIPRGVSFQRPRHRLIAVASLGRLPRNRSIPVWFTRYPRTALGRGISALWFSTRVVEDAGCKTLTIYGIPDAQICKRNLNVSIPSVYWNQKSPDLCENGVDASVISIQSKTSTSQVPTISERKSLPAWIRQHFFKFDFKSPSWIQSII
ncbi:uncharacterized protein TNCV_1361581 [Trichonephila clavipes]|nr:uncharacterized protein TNCV_1361581 [Trichonephila clavipes]